MEPRDTPREESLGHTGAAQDQAARERAAVRPAARGPGQVQPFLATGGPGGHRQEGETSTASLTSAPCFSFLFHHLVPVFV